MMLGGARWSEEARAIASVVGVDGGAHGGVDGGVQAAKPSSLGSLLEALRSAGERARIVRMVCMQVLDDAATRWPGTPARPAPPRRPPSWEGAEEILGPPKKPLPPEGAEEEIPC
ncbi:hypothetical protein [Chondromyces apiculatus]|uniref:Uncharacterized protein n=1 Tax=Chondromyces apiculatus DSM 436 TaxID=1192034 RepID=A0A017SUF0_9BACT|nr:hypothetical protein [Chondromyces apiculatus]EYF00593.1 Hypothetical protein CAP_0464 [Chondromyces apiculatus DSM 436]